MAKSDNDLLAELDALALSEPSPAKASSRTPAPPKKTYKDDDDALAELEALAKPSRPSTPRSRRAEFTPASSVPASGRNSSEDRMRNSAVSAQAPKSGESLRGYHQGITPGDQAEKSEPEFSKTKAEQATAPPASTPAAPAAGGGGGWWGSMYSAATAAVKQAETMAKDLRSNEEAQRWADQVRNLSGKAPLNLSSLQNLSTDLRTRALPTFTSLMEHIAPPISAHERLQIHITHDILGYPSLDPIVYRTFERTMAQVEGGELMVIQRGSEQRGRPRESSELQGYRGGVLGGGSGWSDGPWWRDESVKRSLGTVPGLKEGTRLARVSAEAYAREFFDSRGGVESAAEHATKTLSETNPVRSSDIFLSIQAISYPNDTLLFADDGRQDAPAPVVEPEESTEESTQTTFAIYLHDPIHSLSFSALSQPFPAKWAGWLDAANDTNTDELPESIREIIASGGVDPREWVSEWMEEVISLGVGIVAQRYVARRMGVGEGGLGRGKRRVEEDAMGGEAARAI